MSKYFIKIIYLCVLILFLFTSLDYIGIFNLSESFNVKNQCIPYTDIDLRDINAPTFQTLAVPTIQTTQSFVADTIITNPTDVTLQTTEAMPKQTLQTLQTLQTTEAVPKQTLQTTSTTLDLSSSVESRGIEGREFAVA